MTTTELVRERYIHHADCVGSINPNPGAGFDDWLVRMQHPSGCAGCGHSSDCSLHNEPAMRAKPCDCGAAS